MIDLYIRSGDAYTEAPHAVVLACAEKVLGERFRTGALILTDPTLVKVFVLSQLAGLDHEVFAAILLDQRDGLIDYVELFQGTVDSAQIFPGQVVKAALSRSAAAVIFVHNHPRGNSTPSVQDRVATQRLKNALALVDIEVRDHLIVGQTVTSFAESGYL